MPSVHAHTGMKNETQIRIEKSSLKLVTRTSPELAWHLLGPGAPAGPLEKAFAEAKPRLEKTARSLFVLTAGDKTLKPKSVHVALEVDRHVAFVVTYPRPGDPKLNIRATFLSQPGFREPAELSFFDQSTRAFPVETEPFATLELFSPKQVAEFSVSSAQIVP